jgi:hypothetical protein
VVIGLTRLPPAVTRLGAVEWLRAFGGADDGHLERAERIAEQRADLREVRAGRRARARVVSRGALESLQLQGGRHASACRDRACTIVQKVLK